MVEPIEDSRQPGGRQPRPRDEDAPPRTAAASRIRVHRPPAAGEAAAVREAPAAVRDGAPAGEAPAGNAAAVRETAAVRDRAAIRDEAPSRPGAAPLSEGRVAVCVPGRVDEARDLVAALLAEHASDADPPAVADALLVTSEVVTNALRHGGGITGFEARIGFGGPAACCLLISVADRSPALPASPSGPRPPGAVGGYGWAMVRKLAAHATAAATADGKVVHVRMELPRAAGQPRGPAGGGLTPPSAPRPEPAPPTGP
ncbi:ATP-binding protein [Streptomyces sp. ODS05-4]|uniref:ATP-binding protein n=1 Tax=Streptomyces sp. ODS05-4 TaxID=2944939 RepID=UPI002108F961|nr:ATP-binding protein [Streptomyces sp. ODS05-4]